MAVAQLPGEETIIYPLVISDSIMQTPTLTSEIIIILASAPTQSSAITTISSKTKLIRR